MNAQRPSLTVRTTPETREAIEKYANERGISLSAAVSTAIYELFQKMKKESA